MKRSAKKLPSVMVIAAGIWTIPTLAHACTVCMGDSNSDMAGAANGAIFVMLGILGLMFGATGAFGYYIYRRANTPLPAHLEFVESLTHNSDA